jgi:hypothetical protein
LEHGTRGKNNRSRRKRRRVLTLIRIIFCHHKIFGEGIQKGKEMVRTWGRTRQDWAPPLFCPSWEHTFKGGYETETRHSNAHLSIYGMGVVPTFVIKGDTSLAMRISFTCIIRDVQ